MTYRSLAVSLWTVSMAAQAADVKADGAKVFVGDEGIRFDVVWLAPKANNKVVVLVSGTQSEMDGKALPHDWREDARGRVDVVTQWKGRDFYTLTGRRGWGDRTQYEGYVPGKSDLKLHYDEDKSKALDPKAVLAVYKKALDSGELAALQRFDRQARVDAQNKQLEEKVEATNQACGSALKARIDWKSIQDEQLKKLSISSYCDNALAGLRKVCTTQVGKKTVQEKVKDLTCQFGEKLALGIQPSGAVSFTTAEDAANQEAWAEQQWMKSL